MSVPIQLVKPKDPEKVIELLEDLLERAKKGEFDALMVIARRPEGTWMESSSGVRNLFELLGMVTAAQFSINERMRDG